MIHDKATIFVLIILLILIAAMPIFISSFVGGLSSNKQRSSELSIFTEGVE